MGYLQFSPLLEELPVFVIKKNIHCDVYIDLYTERSYNAVYSMSVWIGDGGCYIRSLHGGISVLTVQTVPLSLQGLTAPRHSSSSQYLTRMSL